MEYSIYPKQNILANTDNKGGETWKGGGPRKEPNHNFSFLGNPEKNEIGPFPIWENIGARATLLSTPKNKET